MRRLRNHQGFATLNDKPSILEFFEILGNLDLTKLTKEQKEGLAKVVNSFDVKDGLDDARAFKTSHGATHEVLDISKYIDKISGIQVTAKVGREGAPLTRVYDYVLNDGWHVDKKAWAPENIEKFLPLSAKPDVKVKGEARPGQLFKDFVAAGTGTKIRWSFDARAGEVYDENKLLEIIEDSLYENYEDVFKLSGIKVDTSIDTEVDKAISKIMENIDVEIGEF